MKTVYTAVWYDPKKVEAAAIKAGWDPNCGDGFLDIYFPGEDPNGHDERDFTSLTKAMKFLQKKMRAGEDFWDECHIDEYEIGGNLCRYCTCRGMKRVRHYIVGAEGIIGEHSVDDCAD